MRKPSRPSGRHEDLVGVARRAVPTRIGDDDDLELEPLRAVDRQQPDDVGALLLRDRFQLRRADRPELSHEADEALDVGTAELLVRAGEPRQLAEVRVAPPAVPLGEDREVVVVLGDDPLAESLQGRACGDTGQPVVALPEGPEELRVALGEPFRAATARARRRAGAARPHAAEVEQCVVRDADERRGEHGHQRLVVVAVVQQAQVREQVDDLLLVVVAAPGRAEGRQPQLAERLLVEPRVGAGGEQEHDLARSRLAGVDELLHPRGDMLRLGGAPVRAGVLVASTCR